MESIRGATAFFTFVCVWVGRDVESAKQVDPESVTKVAWSHYLREMSFEHWKGLAAKKTGAAALGTLRMEDVAAGTTLDELAELLCTTHKMTARRKHTQPSSARSGGFVVACTPCGYITDAFEFMGSTSSSGVSSISTPT